MKGTLWIWKIEPDEHFDAWFQGQDEDVKQAILTKIKVLKQFGPQCNRPTVDKVEGSDFDDMKELRIKVNRQQYRVLFAFDSLRQAVLLVGGMKGGKKNWCKTNIPLADARFQRWETAIKKRSGR